MTKTTKAESNLRNAFKSTGPKSATGKAASAQNSLRHGVLSSHLILPNESREEFDALQSELQQEFMPQDLLEMSLVERIAIALWRQRRLVRAESGEIELRLSTSKADALGEIKSALNLQSSDKHPAVEWEGILLLEEERTSDELLVYANTYLSAVDSGIDIKSLQHRYPLIYMNLMKDTARHGQSDFTQYLENEFGDLNAYLSFNCTAYFNQWQSVKVRELVQIYKKSISLPKAPENMARYQSSLDNELYKAMRALREAQSWRAERRLNVATTVSDTKTD